MWLRSVRAHEIETGIDHRELACYAGKMTVHVRERLGQAQEHLAYALGVLPSESDTEETQRELWEGGRRTYLGLIAAAATSLASALTALGCTDELLMEEVRQSLADLQEAVPTSDVLKTETPRCQVCEAEVSATPVRSLLLPEGVYLCEEEDCEEKYEGTETVRLAVLDIRQSRVSDVEK